MPFKLWKLNKIFFMLKTNIKQGRKTWTIENFPKKCSNTSFPKQEGQLVTVERKPNLETEKLAVQSRLYH